MSDGLNLDSFLQSLTEGGEYVQTSEFTLNSLKAREKLSQSQLPDSGLWLVKLVQAAVASGAPSISIKFGKRKVTVQFANTGYFEAGGLMHCVLSGEIPSEVRLLHAVTGIRGSSTFSSESVSWRCGGKHATLDSGGSKVETVNDDGNFTLTCTRPSRQRSFTKTLATSVSQLAKETVEEYDALHSRCWPCPIPIYLDGKELPRGFNLPRAGYVESNPLEVVFQHSNHRNRIVRCVLAVGGCPAARGSLTLDYDRVVHEEAEPEVGKPVYLRGTFLSWPAGPQPSGAVVVLESETHIENSVDFVLDGALVERRPIPLVYREAKFLGITFNRATGSVRLRIVVPVKHEQLDLSQFAVRGESVEEITRRCLPTLTHMLKALKERRSEFWYVCLSKRYSKLAAGGFTVQTAAVVLATKGIGLIPMGGVGAFVVASNTMLWRNTTYKALGYLQGALEDYLPDVAKPI